MVSLLHKNPAKKSLTAPSDWRKLEKERGERWQKPSQARPPRSSQTLTWLFGGDVDRGTGGAGPGRVVRPDCQVIQRVASQVADFCRCLVADCSDPFCVLFLLVVPPASDLGSGAGTCLPPSTGWWPPGVSSANSGTSAQSARATGTDPAPRYHPFLLLARSQPGCSAPSPGPRVLPGHEAHSRRFSPASSALHFHPDHTQKETCKCLPCDRNLHVWNRQKEAKMAQDPPAPWQAGAALQ